MDCDALWLLNFQDGGERSRNLVSFALRLADIVLICTFVLPLDEVTLI